MLRLLAVLVSLAVVLVVAFRVAQADPPNRHVIDEIQELRQQVGPAGQVVGDQQEFAQALEGVAEQSQGSHGAYDAPSSGFEQPFRNDNQTRSMDRGSWRAPPGWADRSDLTPQRNQTWNQAPGLRPVRPASGHDLRRDGPTFDNRPPRYDPPRGPKPHRSPQELLRTSAFELDRLAHELEMTELFKEADALRDAAGTLRKSARKSGETAPDDPGPTAKERTAKPKQGRSPKRSRGTRLERSLRDQSDRLPRIDRPELPKRSLDLLAPPTGIHGGPTDQLERAILESRNQLLQRSHPSQPAEPLPANGE